MHALSQEDIISAEILDKASEVDPEGTRTIGVLTRPDLICEDECQTVVDTLLNIRRPLGLGYVAVKVRHCFVSKRNVTVKRALFPCHSQR